LQKSKTLIDSTCILYRLQLQMDRVSNVSPLSGAANWGVILLNISAFSLQQSEHGPLLILRN
jgi:hypothetical protein